MEQGRVRLTLPFPPSVNHYWLTCGKRRFISDDGRQFAADVHAEVIRNRVRGFGDKARLSVSVDVYPPDNRKRDLDNLCKALFDSLTKAGVWGDDGQIDRIVLEREKKAENGFVVVEIEERRRNQ